MVGLFYSSTRVLCIRTIAPPFALAGEEMMVMMKYGCKKHLFQVWWCGQELNQRHQDFQSCALPTELPHHVKNLPFSEGVRKYTAMFSFYPNAALIFSKKKQKWGAKSSLGLDFASQ